MLALAAACLPSRGDLRRSQQTSAEVSESEPFEPAPMQLPDSYDVSFLEGMLEKGGDGAAPALQRMLWILAGQRSCQSL